MKITSIAINNRRKGLELTSEAGDFFFPYSRLRLKPTARNRIREVYVDPELGGEAFTYSLEDGRDDTVHLDAVLDYNAEPEHMRNLLLHRLTVEARRRLESSGLSRREVMRRLDTSASQLYRLLDTTNTTKSLGQMVDLLQVLGCDVDVIVTDRDRRTA